MLRSGAHLTATARESTSTSAARSRAVHWVLIGAQVCFGSLPVAGRMALGRIPPNAIVITRLTAGAIGFWIWAHLLGTTRIARRDWPAIAGLALLGVVGNQLLFMNGLVRSTATNAAVLGSTIPVFTALFAIALRREVVRGARLAGIAVALIGALVLAGADGLSTSPEHLAGSGMILANSACYGLYLVLARPLAQRYSPILLTAAIFTVGTIVVAPLGVIGWADAPPLEVGDLAFLAFLIAVPTLGAYSLTQIGLRRAEASLVASYIYLQPLVTAIGAVILLGERPGLDTAIAAAFIFGGVLLSTRA